MRILQPSSRLPYSSPVRTPERPGAKPLPEHPAPTADLLTLSRPAEKPADSVKFGGGSNHPPERQQGTWLKTGLISGLLALSGKPAWGYNTAENATSIIHMDRGNHTQIGPQIFLPPGIKSVNEQYYAERSEQVRLTEKLQSIHAEQVENFVQKAGTGHQDEVHKLLAQGLDINQINKAGVTALGQAIKNGQHAMVNFLIDQEVDVNKPFGPDETTPLIEAVDQKNFKILQSLINAKADVNKGNKNGLTPLMSAASHGNAKIMQKLIDAKADVNLPNKGGFTPLHLATISGKKKGLDTLIKAKANVNQADHAGHTPLIFAVYCNHVYGHSIDILKTLIKAGADVNQADDEGRTPLIYAAAYGNMETAKELVAAKANINHVDSYGRTALMYAENPRLFSDRNESPHTAYPSPVQNYDVIMVPNNGSSSG